MPLEGPDRLRFSLLKGVRICPASRCWVSGGRDTLAKIVLMPRHEIPKFEQRPPGDRRARPAHSREATGWVGVWRRMNDRDLESAARNYLWLAQASPRSGRQRLEEIAAEAASRGKPEIIEQAQENLAMPVKRKTAGRKAAPGRYFPASEK
jgi:hypothetical protein